jgi:hypothetical protein
MFGIAARRARRAADAESARLSDLATQLDYFLASARAAAAERRLWVIPAAIVLCVSLLFFASAVASAHSVGWDIRASVPMGRHNSTGPLWVELLYRVGLALLLVAAAVAFRVNAQRSIRTSERQLAEFYATHSADLDAIKLLRTQRASADATLTERVRNERDPVPSASTAELHASVPPALAPELRRVLAGVPAAVTKRRVSYVLGTVFVVVGLIAMSFGIAPANDVGWDMGRQMPGGRLDGTLPLWFVFSVSMLAGVLVFAGGVAHIVSGWSAVQTATQRLVRFRIEHNVLWPQPDPASTSAPAQDPDRQL